MLSSRLLVFRDVYLAKKRQFSIYVSDVLLFRCSYFDPFPLKNMKETARKGKSTEAIDWIKGNKK